MRCEVVDSCPSLPSHAARNASAAAPYKGSFRFWAELVSQGCCMHAPSTWSNASSFESHFTGLSQLAMSWSRGTWVCKRSPSHALLFADLPNWLALVICCVTFLVLLGWLGMLCSFIVL